MFENDEKRFKKDIFLVFKICYTKEALKCSADLCILPEESVSFSACYGEGAVNGHF